MPLSSVKILSLIFELARSSTSFMLQLVQMKAMELISYLLEKVVMGSVIGGYKASVALHCLGIMSTPRH